MGPELVLYDYDDEGKAMGFIDNNGDIHIIRNGYKINYLSKTNTPDVVESHPDYTELQLEDNFSF